MDSNGNHLYKKRKKYHDGPLFAEDEMDGIFHLYHSDYWHVILHHVRQNPSMATTPMIMDNHTATTITHWATTSKGVLPVTEECGVGKCTPLHIVFAGMSSSAVAAIGTSFCSQG